ncbi:MAG: acetoacetate decarboxylase family protein [Chloroflexi bacterium]|nr:acetoacetate decarboxylase family protein [Chloroflexota bacterium]
MTIKRLGSNEGYGMPGHRPYIPPLPTFYKNVNTIMVFFRADPARLRAYLPEPLEPAADGLCMAFGLNVLFCSSYGPFHEAGVQIKVDFRGQPAFFVSHLYLDNVPAICSGRERWGAPKEYAQVTWETHQNLVVCSTVKDGVTIMTMTTDLGEPAQPEELPPLLPSYRLKVIPKADGPGAAIKQLVTAAPVDVVVHLRHRCTGTVAFGGSANSDLRPLAPIEEVGASYQIASLTETYGKIVYDYLNPEA